MAYTNTPKDFDDYVSPASPGTALNEANLDVNGLAIAEIQALLVKVASAQAQIAGTLNVTGATTLDTTLTVGTGLTVTTGGAVLTGAVTGVTTLATSGTITSAGLNSATSVFPSANITHTSGAMTMPATSGNTPDGILSVGYYLKSWAGAQIDFGVDNFAATSYATPAWIQARAGSDFSVNRALLINPNGGTVDFGGAIVGQGTLTTAGKLTVSSGGADITGTITTSTGATGSFTTVDGKTVTVTSGIITAITA